MGLPPVDARDQLLRATLGLEACRARGVALAKRGKRLAAEWESLRVDGNALGDASRVVIDAAKAAAAAGDIPVSEGAEMLAALEQFQAQLHRLVSAVNPSGGGK